MAITLTPVLTNDDPPQIAAAGNTYGTIAEADTYLEQRYGGGCFSTDAEEKKQLALAAMRVLRAQKWIGIRVADDQPEDWPRMGTQYGTFTLYATYNTSGNAAYYLCDVDGRRYTSRTIPTRLKEAQFEIMLALYQEAQAQRTGFVTAQKVISPQGVTGTMQRKPAGWLPEPARELLYPLLRISLGAIR